MFNFTFENFIFALGVLALSLLMACLVVYGVYLVLRCMGYSKRKAIDIITLRD